MNKQIRLNSEKKINNDLFNLKIGTTNKIEPIVVYIEGKTFITPKFSLNDYCKDINDIEKKFKKNISLHLKNNNLFDNKFILNFEVASTRIIKDKKTFVSFQFLIKQINKKIKKLKEIKELSEFMILDLVSDLKNDFENHNFLLSKTKK